MPAISLKPSHRAPSLSESSSDAMIRPPDTSSQIHNHSSLSIPYYGYYRASCGRTLPINGGYRRLTKGSSSALSQKSPDAHPETLWSGVPAFLVSHPAILRVLSVLLVLIILAHREHSLRTEYNPPIFTSAG